MRWFSRWAIVCLGLVAFFAPLKFGTPVVVQSVLLVPSGVEEWLFFSWPNQFGVLFCFGTLLWLVLDGRRMAARVDGLFVLPVVLLLALVAAFHSSINPQVSADTVLHFAAGVLLFYAAAWYVRDGASAAHVFGGLGLATFVVCIFALQQWQGGLEETRQMVAESGQELPQELALRLTSSRVFGTLVYPNALAGFLIVAFAPTLAWIWVRGRTWKPVVRWIALIFVGGLIVTCLLLTGSRGGLAAFGAGLMVTVVCFMRRGPGLGLVALVVVFGFLVTLAWVAQSSGLLRVGTSSLEARVDYWRGAVGIVRDYPWLGTGPGTFGSMYLKYKTGDSEDTRLVHNDYLQMWSDAGVVAFVAFVGLAGLAVRDVVALARQRRGDPAAVALCASVTGWAVHILVDFDSFTPGVAWPVFILLGGLQGLKNPSKVAPATADGRQSVTAQWWWRTICVVVVGGVMWVEGRSLVGQIAYSRANALQRTHPSAAYVAALSAARIAGGNAEYWSFAGDQAMALGRWSEAVPRYQAAIRSDPFRPNYHWRLGRAKLAAGHAPAEAAAHFRRAAELHPTEPRYQSERKRVEESVRQAAPALLESPSNSH